LGGVVYGGRSFKRDGEDPLGGLLQDYAVLFGERDRREAGVLVNLADLVEIDVGVPVEKSNAEILVVQPAENWAAKNLPGPFDGTRERGILLQGEMRTGAIVICHVRQQQVAEVAFTEHDNVVEAFPSDRTDQPFGIPVLPW